MMRSIRAIRLGSHPRVFEPMRLQKYSCPVIALRRSLVAKSRSVSLLYSGMRGKAELLSDVKRLMVLSTKVSTIVLSSFQ